jgi:Spy/CpxP family protein refolding chaperone
MKAIIAITFATLLIVTVAIAQQPQQPQQPMHPHPPGLPADMNGPQMPHPPPPEDPLAPLMFPPDMILDHARQLNLTDEQKTFVRSEVQKAMATYQDLQWKLQDQMDVLHETMKSSSVNEQQALAQLDKVLDLEREMKRLHIGLAVRIKNRLTPEQQEQLNKMRMDHDMRMHAPGDMRMNRPDANPGADQVQPPIQ